MASVSVDDVRDVINVSSAEVPDSKIAKMVKGAEQGSSTLSAVRSLLAISLLIGTILGAFFGQKG